MAIKQPKRAEIGVQKEKITIDEDDLSQETEDELILQQCIAKQKIKIAPKEGGVTELLFERVLNEVEENKLTEDMSLAAFNEKRQGIN